MNEKKTKNITCIIYETLVFQIFNTHFLSIINLVSPY